jgi:hypothetical protein
MAGEAQSTVCSRLHVAEQANRGDPTVSFLAAHTTAQGRSPSISIIAFRSCPVMQTVSGKRTLAESGFVC